MIFWLENHQGAVNRIENESSMTPPSLPALHHVHIRIPVIFKENQIPYAFSSILDYHGFSVVIDISSFIQNHEHIENILRKISASRIKNMQRRLDEISKFMQYSETNNNDYDATELIMRELAQVMKL
jgi:hypothetical protein